MRPPKKYVEQSAQVPEDIALEIHEAKRLYRFSLGKKQSPQYYAAAIAVNEKLKALGLTFLLLSPGDAPEPEPESQPDFVLSTASTFEEIEKAISDDYDHLIFSKFPDSQSAHSVSAHCTSLGFSADCGFSPSTGGIDIGSWEVRVWKENQ